MLSVALVFVTLVVGSRSALEAVTVSPAVIPFESAHPYADDTSDLWVYDHGTPGFAFHFSLLELASDGDVIEILDDADNVLETITETWGGGYLSVRIPTSIGKVRLTSNSSGVAAGFVVDRAYSIGASVLDASSSTRPTSLQFGPDGRLYVALMDGHIHAYTVARNGANDYVVTATEIVSEIFDIPNHDDDGALNAAVVGRLLTGLLVEGTAANPVIFTTSSDPRTTRTAGDPNGDTNSGVLSRLTWDGAAWVHLPLVRGLARSGLNHASNGLVRDPATNTMYVAQGGQTNQGGSSAFSESLPEYALSGAVLSIDLTAVGESTYDLPTLDDPARAGDPDAGDPFGGSDGANQSVIDPAGPVQIYAPGFRNPYDLELTVAGRLYVTDNGPSDDLGGPPTDEGAAGICTSPAASLGLWAADGLHYVPGPGYYGGHPNPVRGNPAGSPFGAAVPVANPVECDYQQSGIDDASIASFPASTNGIDEYRPSNLDGLLTGNLFTISWDGTLSRVVLTPAGDDAVLNQAFIPDIGVLPLDVTIPGVGDPFPGTVWVIDWGTGAIHVFEMGGSGDTTAPVLSSASVDGTSLVLTYDEVLDDTSTPAGTDYGVGTDGDAQSVTAVAVSGSAVTLTLSPGVASGDAISLDYTPGVGPVQDVAGNDAASLSTAPVANTTADTTAPALSSASVDGTSLVLTYDEALDEASIPSSAAFSVGTDGDGQTVAAVAVSGSAVTLTLSPGVRVGDAITVDYTPGAAPVQDIAANDAAGLLLTPVTNATTFAEVPLAPGDDFQAAVDANPPGTRFLILSGTHRFQSVNPKDDMAFRGEPGALMTGARVLVGWATEGPLWWVGGQTQQGIIHGGCLPGFPRCSRPEDLFINEIPMRHVATKDDVGPGSWFFDYDADRIYIGDDPAGAAVETSVTRNAFSGFADNVSIRDLVIEKYAALAQEGAISGQNWLIEGVEARLNHGGGIKVRSGGTVRDSYVHTNGQLGIGSAGWNVLIEGNEIAWNNYARYHTSWEAGGTKFALASNGVIRGNWAHDNYGPGIWIDVDGVDLLIEDNVSERNYWSGIFVELTNGAIVRGNYLEANGLTDPRNGWYWDPGILISSSRNADVYGNTVVDNGNGITAVQQRRGTGPWGEYCVENLNVHDNVVTMRRGKSGVVQDYPLPNPPHCSLDIADFATAINHFESNTYYLDAVGAPRFGWDGPTINFATWQAIGNDVTGTVATANSTPPSWGTSLTVTGTTASSVSLAWSGASDPEGIGAYRIYITGQGQVATTAGATVATIRGLPFGVPQTFTVQAVDVMGNESTTGPSVVAMAGPMELATAIPFESLHPYANGTDTTWVYDHGAPGFAFHFSQIDLEVGFDFLQILDGSDNLLETVSLAGISDFTTVDVPTSVGKVRLMADGNTTAAGFVVDRVVAPVVSSIAVDGVALLLTYDTALDESAIPAPGDYSVGTSGVAQSVSSVGVSGSTVTLTLSPGVDFGDTITLDYSPGIAPVEDLGGRPAGALVAEPVTNNTPDTTAPALLVATANGTTIVLDYDEALDESSTPFGTDFAVGTDGAEQTVTGVAISGSAVTLTLSPGVAFEDSLTLDYTPGASPLRDAPGNLVAALLLAPVTNSTTDGIAPVVTAATVDGSSLILTYDRALNESSVPDPADYSVGTSGAGQGVTAVGVSGSDVTVTLSPGVAVGDTVTVDYSPGVTPLQDLDGDTAAALLLEPVTNTTTDLLEPTLLDAAVADTSLLLTYDEPLDEGVVPPTGDYSVASTGAAQSVTAVAVSGRAVTLTLTPGAGVADVLTLTYAPTGAPLQDLAGNPGASFVAESVINGGPRLVYSLASDRSNPTWLEGAVLTGDVYIFLAGADAAGAVTFSLDGQFVRTENLVPWDMGGGSVTTANPIDAPLTFGAGPHAVDAVADGSLVASVVVEVVVPDTEAPTLSSASVDGTSLVLTYDEALDDASTPATTAFGVGTDGDAQSVAAVVVSGSTVTLTLSPGVGIGDAVTIDYTPGAVPVQDVAGNDAVALVLAPVTNTTPDVTAPTLSSASVDGSSLALTYDEPLDEVSTPLSIDYSVGTDGAAQTVTGVFVTAASIILTLAPGVNTGDTVTVDYAVGVAPLQDLAGNHAAALSLEGVANTTVDGAVGTPTDVEAFDMGGEQAVAALFTDPATGAVWVQVRDAATGALVKKVWFGKWHSGDDLEVIPDAGGNPRLAVMGKAPTTGVVWVQIRDALSGALVTTVGFGADQSGDDLEIVVDAVGAVSLAVMGESNTGAVWVQVRDAATGALVKKIGIEIP